MCMNAGRWPLRLPNVLGLVISFKAADENVLFIGIVDAQPQKPGSESGRLDSTDQVNAPLDVLEATGTHTAAYG